MFQRNLPGISKKCMFETHAVSSLKKKQENLAILLLFNDYIFCFLKISRTISRVMSPCNAGE